MTLIEKIEIRLIRRFKVELSAAGIFLATFLVFRNSKNVILVLSTIYILCLSVIYGFRKDT